MTCEEHLTAMVEYLRGELEPLQHTRIESHLAHCDSCATTRDQLAAGLDAARGWQPELAGEDLERRLARLAPYMEPRPERVSLRLAWIAGAMAAAALVVALGLMLGTGEQTLSPEEPTTVFDFSDSVAFDVIAGEPALTRHQPSAHVRLIAPRDWNGSLVRASQRTTIEMSRGFVAVAFAGGKNRQLRVITPAMQVDVIGTRFVVDITEGITTVAVSQGKVRVRAGQVSGLVTAGQVRTVADGELIATEAPPCSRYLEDEYLVEHTPARHPRPRAEPTPKPEDEPAVAISDVLEQLARAEELANDDQVAAAVTIFESCAEDPHVSYDPYRDLCRLQLARLVGFKQGQRARARALLKHLSQKPGQVAREAALALCELELERDPCAAKACLEQLAASGDASARREATGLVDRWNLGKRFCR